MKIVTTSLPDANYDKAYAEQLKSEGGRGTPTWSIVSGKLPAGLQFTSNGIIFGDPTNSTPGKNPSTFTVQVVSGTEKQTRAYTIDEIDIGEAKPDAQQAARGDSWLGD